MFLIGKLVTSVQTYIIQIVLRPCLINNSPFSL